jgi:hypothetical protein
MENLIFKQGLILYRIFKECLDQGKDKPRLKRLEDKLDTWYSLLNKGHKYEFSRLLVDNGLIDPKSPLGMGIVKFGAQFSGGGYA